MFKQSMDVGGEQKFGEEFPPGSIIQHAPYLSFSSNKSIDQSIKTDLSSPSLIDPHNSYRTLQIADVKEKIHCTKHHR